MVIAGSNEQIDEPKREKFQKNLQSIFLQLATQFSRTLSLTPTQIHQPGFKANSLTIDNLIIENYKDVD